LNHLTGVILRRGEARAGLPLIALIWIAFSLFAPWYFRI